MQLSNKVALITGATRGFGRDLATAFAREGAKVVVHGRQAAKIAETVDDIVAAGGIAFGVEADVANSSDVRVMFEKILGHFGTLDILVNNAALTPSSPESARARKMAMDLMTTPVPKHSLGVTKSMSDEDWAQMMRVNVDGTFYCTREALKIMEAKRYGRIVNIASIAGLSGLSFHSPHYSASKGAIVAFTRSVALEVIGAGVAVNCIAAGGIATEAWNQAFAAMGETLRAQVMQMIPAGRLGSIAEFTSLAVYLAGEQAGYLVGQVISPNGGVVT